MQQLLTVGQLARAAGVSTKTVRYYEQVGVLPVPRRSPSGYRQYVRRDVHRLLFFRRARALGLPLKNLKTLTGESENGQCEAVRSHLSNLIQAQLQTVQQRIVEFQLLHRQLEQALHQLSTVPPSDSAEGCQCLDLDAAPPQESSPPDTQKTLEALTILAATSGDHDGQCGCGCGCELPLTQVSRSQEAAEHVSDEESEPSKTR